MDMNDEKKGGTVLLKEGDGVKFDSYSVYMSVTTMSALPRTYEAWMKLPSDVEGDFGDVAGNYGSKLYASFSFGVAEGRIPQIHYTNGKELGQKLTLSFEKAVLPADEWVHVAVVDRREDGTADCYVNGKLAQSVFLTDEQKEYKYMGAERPFAIGGDINDGLTRAFRGELRSAVLFEDERTAEEVSSDMKTVDTSDDGMIACYDLAGESGADFFRDLKGAYDLPNNRKTEKWLDPSVVGEPEDFDYSIAILGDTQMLTGYYPEKFRMLFDWLLANKDKHKIEHVLNVGDFTNFNYDEEWALAGEQYCRLNGHIDFTLVRGDHDTKNDHISEGESYKKKYDRFFSTREYLSRFDAEDADYYRGEDGSITNSYRRVKIGGIDYLIVTMDKDPSENAIKWLKDALDRNTSDKVIMTMHCYLYPDGNRLIKGVHRYTPKFFDGEDIWNTLASKYENMQFVISGHKITQNVVWTKAVGEHGNIVNQVLVNPQGADIDNHGGAGMVCLLYFKKGSDRVQVRYYSVCLDKYLLKKNQYTVNLNDLEGPKPILE